MSLKNYISFGSEVEKAIADGKPIVALESTIISHGMPYPENLATARLLEDIVRENGAVPATIAIIDGKIKVGLELSELKKLSTAKDVMKVSRKDLPYVVSKKMMGATTVAGTMLIAREAGIKVFATGGIGGVHKGYGEVLDISQDLEELSRSEVAVVSAGVKSILDVANTLEYLETKSVPVIGYGTDVFPEFYSREGEHKLEYVFDSPEEIADMLSVKWNMGLPGGAVIANPVPDEHSMKKADIDKVITKALESAKAKNIKGKETTPYLLKTIVEFTEGKSLKTNIELVKNNAALAAKIASYIK